MDTAIGNAYGFIDYINDIYGPAFSPARKNAFTLQHTKETISVFFFPGTFATLYELPGAICFSIARM
ncbi:MAG: hypothetical protein U0V75_17295 [Ferruginibacter sp.]